MNGEKSKANKQRQNRCKPTKMRIKFPISIIKTLPQSSILRARQGNCCNVLTSLTLYYLQAIVSLASSLG